VGALLALITVGAIAAAQDDPLYQVPYNGRFTFTRIRYGGNGGADSHILKFSRAEIYQYVGDEIVLSWKMKGGL
jgi:hypothetical protein